MPCRNGATCVNGTGDFRCLCDVGFQGTLCEQEVDECENEPCRNGGTCRDLIGTFKCSCPPGTSGTRCEINVDECLSFPCKNNGTCRDLVGGFRCMCVPGFTGRQCEADINECLSQPCTGPGAVGCMQSHPGNGYTCVCMDGWVGLRCQTRSSRCLVNPCRNGGRCLELPSTSLCECPEVGTEILSYFMFTVVIIIIIIIIISHKLRLLSAHGRPMLASLHNAEWLTFFVHTCSAPLFDVIKPFFVWAFSLVIPIRYPKDQCLQFPLIMHTTYVPEELLFSANYSSVSYRSSVHRQLS